MQGGGVEIGYETTLVVRAAGRVFGVVETRGETGHGDTTNYVLFASKVGLGRTGATIGAGAQFATTSARTYDRQAMFQLDRAF